MDNMQMVNRTWEIAMQMVKFAALGVAILIGGLVALVAASVGLATTFGGRAARVVGERLSEAREWAERMATNTVTVICVIAPVGGAMWGVYWIWLTYGGERWTWALLTANVVFMPICVGLMGGLTRGASLILGVVVFGLSWLSVVSPVAAIVIASVIRLGGNYLLWRTV